MAKRKNDVKLLVVTKESIGLYLFEIAGATKRDGERYVKLQFGDTNYALTAKIAHDLGHQLIQAAAELPTADLRRGEADEG